MERGLRQKDAAVQIDVPVATWRNWEKGKRTPNKLALAEIERRMKGELTMEILEAAVKSLESK